MVLTPSSTLFAAKHFPRTTPFPRALESLLRFRWRAIPDCVRASTRAPVPGQSRTTTQTKCPPRDIVSRGVCTMKTLLLILAALALSAHRVDIYPPKLRSGSLTDDGRLNGAWWHF